MAKKKKYDWKHGRTLTVQELDKREQAIRACIEEGITQYKKITEITGLTENQLQLVFRKRPALHEWYKVKLKALKNKVVDNFVSAISDDENPNQWDATKLFMKKYKTPLDDVFESNENSEFSLKGGEVSGVKITFSNQNKNKEDE